MSALRSIAAATVAAAASLLFAPLAQAQTKAAPQLLPYTITAVAGGGPVTVTASTATSTTYTATAFTVGQVCATGSTLTATDTFGDGCLATQVGLVLPRAVVADTQGNVFLIDGYNYLIRRVDARTGVITAYAGNGAATPAAGASCGTGTTLTSTSAFGDGCLATQVKLSSPEGLGIDPSNNVWYSDYTTAAVRRIDHTTGIITTVVNTSGTPGYRAGNVANAGTVVLAAAGQLVHPYGVSFDRAGNLYIADNYNSVVDVVNLQSTATTIANISIPAGAIYTIAGAGCAYGNSTTGCTTYGKTGNGSPSTASTLDSPYQVAVDNAGNIYIADEYPYDVRVINGATGILTTFANGAFTKSATEVRGPALTTSLASTNGVATDSNGNVYIAVYDTTTSSSYLHRVDAATGILYPLAGQVTTAAPAMGAANTAIATATYCAAKTDNIGDGCPGAQSTLYDPFQPFVDATGNAYVVDQKNLLIRKLSVGTQFPAATVGKATTQTIQVHFGAADTQGTYTLQTRANGFGAVDFTVGTSLCTFNSDTTQDCVVPVTFTPTLPGTRTASLVIKSASGLTSSFALTGTGNAAQLLTDPASAVGTLGNYPAVAGLSEDSAGYLYAAVPSVGIVKINGANPTTISTSQNATATTVDPAGNVYAALSSGTIIEIPASGAAQTTLGTGFTTPSGLAADAFGNVFVADSSANTVTRIAAGSLVETVIASGLSSPGGLAVDALGNVFVANKVANNVIEIPFNNAAPITLGTGLSAPSFVAVDAAGSLYISDTKNARIVFIPNENGTLNSADQLTVTTTGLSSPTGIVVSPFGVLYVADSAANTIYIYNRTEAAYAFGNDATGTQVTTTADLISSGTLPVTLSTPYFTAAGNTTDFTVTPSALTSGTTLAAGSGVALTAGFKPTATGARSATFTFNSTNVTPPVLTLTGNGITPVDPTTTTITATPTSGTYGQTVSITIAVAAGAGLPVPSGSVTVKVDSTAYTPTLAAGTVTFTVPGLSAGSHTITASYTGDTNSSPSTATPVTITLAKAPLTVTPNSASKQYLAAIPTLTGTLTGTVNNDTIGVSYTTTATASSPLGTYPITATVTGTAAANYTVTTAQGTLTVTQAGTTTLLTASATSVSSTTSVTLTATVTPSTSGTPTGSVNFLLNGTTPLASNIAVTAGKATFTTTFPTAGNSVITAVYSGDTNYTASTSTALTITTSAPGFNLTGAPTTTTISQGQTALLNFTITPTFSYAGTITFSCTNLPATVGCVFAPSSINTTTAPAASLVALSITTVQPGGLVRNTQPLQSPSNIAFAGIPALALLLGFAARRRKLNLRLLLLLAAFAALTLGASGCGSGHFATPTPTGTYTLTVNANGSLAAGATTAPSQSFALTVIVK